VTCFLPTDTIIIIRVHLNVCYTCTTPHHSHFTALFPDHLGEPVPEENFWTLWCKGRLSEADTTHPAESHSIRTNQCPPPPSPIFLQAGCPSCRPTNSVKALKDCPLHMYCLRIAKYIEYILHCLVAYCYFFASFLPREL